MMATPKKSEKFAVFGHPISHSKSPVIHQQFAKQFGLDIQYQAVDVASGEFKNAVSEFARAGGKGLNVTVPYKLEAWLLADSRSERAELAGAVNTLKFETGSNDELKIFGDNTDGFGLVTDIKNNLKFEIKNKKVLVLGAGGAVRGVLAPLLDCQPQTLVLANRTLSKAETLVEIFGHKGTINATGFEDLADQQFDLVINGTTASLKGEIPPLPETIFTKNALAYDMMYSVEPTAFMVWAKNHGATKQADGLGMLVEQAAESFYIWCGVRPDSGPVISKLGNMM
ncbi:MAG: shikimate dehydrogenase, partial [Acidiferrobacterales bacterium]